MFVLVALQYFNGFINSKNTMEPFVGFLLHPVYTNINAIHTVFVK